jgi:hypothetical protein
MVTVIKVANSHGYGIYVLCFFRKRAVGCQAYSLSINALLFEKMPPLRLIPSRIWLAATLYLVEIFRGRTDTFPKALPNVGRSIFQHAGQSPSRPKRRAGQQTSLAVAAGNDERSDNLEDPQSIVGMDKIWGLDRNQGYPRPGTPLLMGRLCHNSV